MSAAEATRAPAESLQGRAEAQALALAQVEVERQWVDGHQKILATLDWAVQAKLAQQDSELQAVPEDCSVAESLAVEGLVHLESTKVWLYAREESGWELAAASEVPVVVVAPIRCLTDSQRRTTALVEQ